LPGVGVKDADLQVGAENGDLGAGEDAAEADVVQSAVVPQGDASGGVDGVGANPVVGVDEWPVGDGFGAGSEGFGGGVSLQCPVRALGVVVAGEAVQLGLEGFDRGGGFLFGEPFLLGLVEPFDLAAGLGVVGAGVVKADPE